MKNKIICLLCLLPLVISLFIIPSFAEERDAITLGYYPVYVDTSKDFYIDDTFYLLPRNEYVKESYIAYSLSCSQGVVSFGSTIYYPENVPGADFEDKEFIARYNPDTHYLVADLGNNLVGPNVIPLSSDDANRFFSIYPYTLKSNVMLRLNTCIGEQSYHSPIGLQFSRYSYSADKIYILESLVDRFQVTDSSLFDYDLGNNTYGPELISDVYLQPRSNYSFGDFSEDMYRFYAYAAPVTFPDVEQDPVREVPLILIDFISGIFEGLNSLYIFPGVSVMGLIFGIFGILIFRYIIKLLAGG